MDKLKEKMTFINKMKEFHPKNGAGVHVASFPSDLSAARDFAVGVRDKLFEFGIPRDDLWFIVEQRNTNVYMKLEYVDENSFEVNCENEVTSEEFVEEEIQ